MKCILQSIVINTRGKLENGFFRNCLLLYFVQNMEQKHQPGKERPQGPKKKRPNTNFGRFIGDLTAHQETQRALDEFYQFGIEVEWDKSLPERPIVLQERSQLQRTEPGVPRIVTIYSPHEENDVTIIDFRKGENECFS